MYLSQVPTVDKNVTFSWREALIKAYEEIVLCINWMPTTVGAWRENVTLEDGKRIRKDIPIVFKSLDVKVN